MSQWNRTLCFLSLTFAGGECFLVPESKVQNNQGLSRVSESTYLGSEQEVRRNSNSRPSWFHEDDHTPCLRLLCSQVKHSWSHSWILNRLCDRLLQQVKERDLTATYRIGRKYKVELFDEKKRKRKKESTEVGVKCQLCWLPAIYKFKLDFCAKFLLKYQRKDKTKIKKTVSYLSVFLVPFES